MKHLGASLSLVITLITLPALAADLLGTAYEPGTKHSKTLFTYRENIPDNDKNFSVKGHYLGLDGSELVLEQMEVRDGRIATYMVSQNQVKENGLLEVKNGKLNFSYTVGGKTTTNTEDAPKDLVVGLSIVPFIEKHWAEMLRGDSVAFRYAVLDRKETVGFKVFKSEEGKRGDLPTITIKMKPTSFVIAALVDPVLMTFSAKDRELLEIVGRTLPKKQVKGSWEDQDPEMVFHKESKKI